MAVPFPIIVVAVLPDVLLNVRERLGIGLQRNIHAVDGQPVVVSLNLKHDVVGLQRTAVEVV